MTSNYIKNRHQNLEYQHQHQGNTKAAASNKYQGEHQINKHNYQTSKHQNSKHNYQTGKQPSHQNSSKQPSTSNITRSNITRSNITTSISTRSKEISSITIKDEAQPYEHHQNSEAHQTRSITRLKDDQKVSTQAPASEPGLSASARTKPSEQQTSKHPYMGHQQATTKPKHQQIPRQAILPGGGMSSSNTSSSLLISGLSKMR
jgi:hypothetical protein